MAQRYLITGATGLLGPYLLDVATDFGDAAGLARRGADYECDLLDVDDAERMMRSFEPDVVIHAVGFTDVDECERDPARADGVNRIAAENIVSAMSPEKRLVFISTDQVYPDTPGPHVEGHEGPVNTYGRSKLAGEEAALLSPGALILRTNFFGPSRTPGRKSLSDFMIERFSGREEMTLFSDAFFSPLYMKTLCEMTMCGIERKLSGVFNLGCREGGSKADFGLAVASHLELPTSSAKQGRSSDLPGRAPRVLDLRTDVSNIESALGIEMPTLQEEIEKL